MTQPACQFGYEVVEVEAFTKEELNASNTSCSECGAFGGAHREYFIKTEQNGGGEVRGYYRNCSRGGNLKKCLK